MLANLKISHRLVGLLIVTTVIPLLMVGFFAYNSSSRALREEASANLDTLVATREGQISSYYAERIGDVKVLGNSLLIETALPKYEEAFMAGGAESAAYQNVQAKWDADLKHYQTTYGYYDLFLIAADGGVIYTATHEDDFGVNLKQKYQDTGLASVWQEALSGKYPLTDIEAYAPAGDIPAQFVAGQVKNEQGQVLGVVALQISLDQVNGMMQERTGLGETGETYIVGSDYLMRSDSRFSAESTILKQKVETDSVKAGLEDKDGTMVMKDYRGTMVLSSYLPAEIEGLDWVVIAEIEEAEAFASTIAIRNVLAIMVLIINVIATVLGVVVSRGISNPIGAMVTRMQDIAEGEGDLTARIQQDTKDELGELATWLNRFLDDTETIMAQVQGASGEVGTASQQISASSQQSAASMQQIGASTQQMASGAQEQAGAAEKSSQAMRELQEAVQVTEASVSKQSEVVEQTNQINEQNTKVIAEVAEGAGQAAEMATQASDTATQSQDAMRQLGEGMRSINERNQVVGDNINQLTQASDEIGQIVEAISAIASQTNLLALNAAIEAARAGEAGRGFAVVAEEVRNLAESTSDEVQRIGDLVTGIQDTITQANEARGAAEEAVQQGMEHTDTSIAGLDQIVEAVEQVAIQIQNIAASSQQMSAAGEQVVEAMASLSTEQEQLATATGQVAQSSQQTEQLIDEIASISQETAASSQQVAASVQQQSSAMQQMGGIAQQMASMAQELNGLVGRFKVSASKVAAKTDSVDGIELLGDSTAQKQAAA